MRPALALAAATAALAAAPAWALSPVMACDGTIEAGMRLGGLETLGGWQEEPRSGVVVESYVNAAEMRDGAWTEAPPPVPELDLFQGVRVTFCPTGEFLAIPGGEAGEVSAALAATEFLRDAVQAGEAVGFADLRRAADALYGPVLVMRETEQTCGCSVHFDDLRPSGQTPFEERTDVHY